MWSEGRDDIEEVYNGRGEVLLLATRRSLAKKRKEGSKVCCWRGLGILLFQSRLECSQDNGRLRKYKLVFRAGGHEKNLGNRG